MDDGGRIDSGERPLAAAHILLEANPHAVLVACTSDGMPVAVPADVPVSRSRCPTAPRGLEPFSHGDLDILAGGLAEALRTGHATVSLHYTDQDAGYSDALAVHIFDVRSAFGVMLVALVPRDQSGAFEKLFVDPEVGRLARIARDAQGIITSVDEVFARLLGLLPSDLIGRRSSELLHPEDLPLALANWVELTRNEGMGRRVRLRYRTADRHYVWFEVTSVNRLQQAGEITSDLVDISAEMEAQERIAEREQLLHSLTEALPLGVLQMDARGGISYANSRLCQVLGTERTSDVADLIALVDRADRAAFAAAVHDVLLGTDADLQVLISPTGGRPRVCDASLRRLSGAVTEGAIICFTEVTEAVRLRQQLESQASHDSLTGCLNRRAILNVLAAAAGHEERRRRGLAAVFLDLNGFKAVNDRFGHAAGDELLALVGHRLRGMLREDDAVGRLGGDEFLMLFHGIGDSADAQRVGDRVAALLDGEVQLAAGAVEVSASVGVSWIHQATATADQLVAAADAAMYTAKRAGRRTAVLAE